MAARNLYKRGATWWGRVQVAGSEHRRSLRTSDRAEAVRRLKAWKLELSAPRIRPRAAQWQETVRATSPRSCPARSSRARPSAICASLAARPDPRRAASSTRSTARTSPGSHIGQGPTNATRRRDLTAASAVLRAAVRLGLDRAQPAARLRPRHDPRAPRPDPAADRSGDRSPGRRLPADAAPRWCAPCC